MALPRHRSSSSWLFSIQVLFSFIGAVSVAVLLSLYLPAVVKFAAIEVPATWACVAAWLRPPYLHVVINAIIITIVASSWLQQNGARDASPEPEFAPAAIDGGVGGHWCLGESSQVYVSHLVDDKASEVKSAVLSGFEEDDEGEVVISATASTGTVVVPMEHVSPVERISPVEKPVSTRIGRRRTLKAAHDGSKALKVAKPKRHETLETTWKMITQARPMPLMNKCDTWDRHARRADPISKDLSPDPKKGMGKSDTLRDRTKTNHPQERVPLVRLRKEPSLSQAELNTRVEAFINKFKQQMRLQRQASLEQ